MLATTDTSPPRTIPPSRRSDLLMKPLGEDGQRVVKDLRTGTYFKLPPAEAFLLEQLDGLRSADEICTAFTTHFGEPLGPEDLDEFVLVAREQNLLATPELADETAAGPATAPAKRRRPLVASLLQMRRSVFDPDRLFTWLAPRLALVWTPAFVIGSLAVIALAGMLLWQNLGEFTEFMPESLGWETVVLGWLILCVFTTFHEFAHGLTCKRFGGEVHEVGVMLMLFMPCFYCDVSDAWLIRQRSRRLWVTLAGAYCDLCFWAVAVLLWRLLLPHTLPYRVCWLVISICGGRVLLNLNPFIKLDGYYLLADWLEIPNLRPQGLARVAAHLRWLLWGADRPAKMERGLTLLCFGLASWLVSAFYLSMVFYGGFRFLYEYVGWAALTPIAVVMWVMVPGLCAGLSEGEVMNMLKSRPLRTAAWLLLIVGVPTALCLIPKDEAVSASFRARPAVRVEVRAPSSGFLQEVRFDEGQAVEAGTVVACLDVPDLPSRLTQKRAEEREADARLKLLLAGSRPEEIAEQRDKVQRAKAWVERAAHELTCRQAALKEELHRLDESIVQARAQMAFAAGALERSEKLFAKNVLPLDQLEDARRGCKQAEGALTHAETQKRERLAIGTLLEEGEAHRRGKEWADAKSALKLLEAGARPEVVEAEKAHLARVQEERAFLEKLQTRLQVVCPVRGVLVTPRLREKRGVFLREGDLICEIEDPDSVELEVTLDEQDVGRVEPSQTVDVKPRALPLQTFQARVDRLAPLALPGRVQSTVLVYCRLEPPTAELRSGMTGYARIHCGEGTVASYLFDKAIRYLRTEVWW